MIVKNLERIRRMIIQIDGILETDPHIDRWDRAYLLQAQVTLEEVCKRHMDELGADNDRLQNTE